MFARQIPGMLVFTTDVFRPAGRRPELGVRAGEGKRSLKYHVGMLSTGETLPVGSEKRVHGSRTTGIELGVSLQVADSRREFLLAELATERQTWDV